MRNSDPIFFPTQEADLSIRQQMNRNYTDCINILQTCWTQFDLDQRFAMGDQDIWSQLFPNLATYRRKIFNFNIINPILQMVSGYQRRNRKATSVVPIHGKLQDTADIFTKCLYHVHDKAGVYQVYSDCFEQGALTQGLGLLGITIDYSDDPISGDIKVRYVDPKSILIDPYFRCRDFSDCRFIWTRQFFDRDEACALYPQLAEKIRELPTGTYRDDKFYYMPEVYQIQFPNLVAFDEYWYLATRQATFLVDTDTNEVQEAPFHADEEDLRVMISQGQGKLKVIRRAKQTVRRAILINDRVVLDEPNPYGIDRYPYVPMLAYFTPDTPYYAYKFRGMTRDLRDAQYLMNRMKVSNLDIVESQQQGIMVKKGALVTPEDSLNQGHGRVLTINTGYSMDDVRPMDIRPPHPVLLQMEQFLQEIAMRIAGVNETMLGNDINDRAGIISMLRNAAGVTTLTRLYDQFDEAQRMAGEIMVEMIQKNWTWGKVKAIIGEDPTAEFDHKAFFKYGCKIVQSALTETQQQLQLQQLLYFRETTGIDVPSEVIIEASSLQNKTKLVEAIMQREKAKAEQDRKMAELQLQAMQVDNETKMAYAHSQHGLAEERLAKIQLDKAVNAERISRAQEDRSSGILNLIKAVKELQGMDLNNILAGIDIVERLTTEQKAEEATSKHKEVSYGKETGPQGGELPTAQ